MKILVVNGSPRGAAGNTEVLVEKFLEGAAESGAECETVYLKELKIEHCVGCFSCWARTPGVCAHKDDMAPLLQKLLGAELLVCATPLYYFTVTGFMKDFMDRMLPLAQPFMVKRGDHYAHPARYERSAPMRVALISNCGFPEPHNFDALKELFRVWMFIAGQPLAASICCAGGSMLRSPMVEMVGWYLDAVRSAGREVAAGRPVPAEIQSVLDRSLIPDPAMYVDRVNEMWRSAGVK